MEMDSEGEPAKFHVQIQSIRHIDLIIEKWPVPNPRHVTSVFYGEMTDMKPGAGGGELVGGSGAEKNERKSVDTESKGKA